MPQLELLLDSLKDNIFTLDTRGYITYLNARCTQTLGLKTEAIGKKIWKAGSSVLNDEAKKAILEVLEKSEPKTIHWSNPSDVFWEMTLTPYTEGVTGVFREVTSDKRARIALEESEDKYRNLVENAKDSIITVDFKGNVLFANHASETITGYSISEISNIKDVTPKGLWMKAVSMLLRAKLGKPIPYFEYEIRKKDGTIIPVETGGQAIVKNGKTVAIQIITRDITERKKAEQALQEQNKKIAQSEARYRELYDSLDEAFIATDWDLNVTHWNKAAERMIKTAEKEAIGKKIIDVLNNSNFVDLNRYFDSLLAGNRSHFTVNHKSLQTGRQSIFKISVHPFANGIQYIFEDKTEEENNRRLSTIGATASMVGHDIRNPLQAIVGDVYLLKNYLDATSNDVSNDVQECLTSIDNNVGYINKIVADLQDYSRQLKPEERDFDVSEIFQVIHNTVDFPPNVAFSFKEKNIRLRADPEFIRRALVNLVTNAIQALPNGGKVELSAFEKNNRVYLVVADNGIGIPEDVKPNLFTPMVTTKPKGQGLGLAVVKRLVEAQGGNVTFESKVDKGTKFIVELPK